MTRNEVVAMIDGWLSLTAPADRWFPVRRDDLEALRRFLVPTMAETFVTCRAGKGPGLLGACGDTATSLVNFPQGRDNRPTWQPRCPRHTDPARELRPLL